MAGRKDLYPEEGDGLEINGAEEAGGAGDGDGAEGAGGAEGAVAELPLTVMLSHADGDDLLLRMGMGAADQGQGQIRGQRLAVDYSLQHVLFSSALMGDSTVKLYAQPDVIIALGSGSSGWGAVVKATQGEDWQLFLMSKDDILDMLSQAPLQVLSQGGQSKSLSRTVLSAVHLYAHTIERKCPDIVHRIDGATVYIKN
ncbi:hypothetical protein B484DRAFT_426829 [Ochromonadaceae sp. CCMP2298]|nr:hypothetical protein B484DRAFT_426829 [Ochromonadaceae sp. CCMP2298]